MSVNVTFENLTVDLGGNRILDGVDMEIPAGSFVTLLGPSGSGKTTTLNVLAGFIHRSGGHVRVGGRTIDDVPAHERNIGFLFQNYALFPHMTVGENIAFPLQARKIPAARRKELVAQALQLVQLPDMQGRNIRSLSGGQQQRVALARALVFQPSLLLLDEPLAALDKQLREAMQLELKRIQLETGTTTIAVTHDQVEAMSMADLVAIMNNGRLAQVGTPEEVYARPADLFVATFLGEANLLPVTGGRVAVLRHEAMPNRREGTAVVRPEHLGILEQPRDNTVPGRVALSVFQGTRRRVTVDCDGLDAPLVASVPPGVFQPQVGDEVHVDLRNDILHVVPPEAPAPEVPEKVEALA
jgi:putative spermidine/putrescine transport system ATP-binding protein